MVKNQAQGRQIKNLFLRPGVQFKFFISAAALGQFVLGFTFVAYLYFTEYILSLGSEISASEEMLLSFRSSIFWMRVVVIVMTLIVISGSFIVASLFMHRIYGPTVPMLKLIRELQQGHYGGERTLRKNDELQEVMAELNQLSQQLKERHSQA